MKTSYKKLCDAVDKILDEKNRQEMLRFSIFDTLEEGSDDFMETWIIEAPDFNSQFSEGKVRFINSRTGFKSKMVQNPTWSDVVYWANESILWGMKTSGLDGWDHVFLEQVELKEEGRGIKIFEFWFGS